MPFTLPSLPYSANALAGDGMCQETLELHHGKHHQAYVTALNGLIESKGLQGKSLEQIVADAGKQASDHDLAWGAMMAVVALPSARAGRISSVQRRMRHASTKSAINARPASDRGMLSI